MPISNVKNEKSKLVKTTLFTENLLFIPYKYAAPARRGWICQQKNRNLRRNQESTWHRDGMRHVNPKIGGSWLESVPPNGIRIERSGRQDLIDGPWKGGNDYLFTTTLPSNRTHRKTTGTMTSANSPLPPSDTGEKDGTGVQKESLTDWYVDGIWGPLQLRCMI